PENLPGLRHEAESGEVLFGNIDTFLLWKLTGGPHGGIHATDVTNASRTQLMDLKALAWDPEMLRTFSIPARMLPRIGSSSELFGSGPLPPPRRGPAAGALAAEQPAPGG